MVLTVFLSIRKFMLITLVTHDSRFQLAEIKLGILSSRPCTFVFLHVVQVVIYN